MDVCGLREGFSLREYQKPIIDETLKEFEEKSRQNILISLPEGTGKTVIALAALSKLVNDNKVTKVLVLIPRRVLVNQWVDKAQEMFYGLGLIKNPTLSKESKYHCLAEVLKLKKGLSSAFHLATRMTIKRKFKWI